MDQGHILTVVQGEASESDDEEICSITDRASDKTTTEGSVVVAGEASESDEDDVVSNIPPLRVQPNIRVEPEVADDITRAPPSARKLSNGDKLKYQTLLHRKLFDKNVSLRKNLIEARCQPYKKASRDLHNTTQFLMRTQSTVQEVSQNIRQVTNNLFHLEDRIDIITTCNLLPNLNIEIPTSAAGAQGAAPVSQNV